MSADVIAAVLAKHQAVKDGVSTEYFGPRLSWHQCTCRKWKSSTTRGWRDETAEHLSEHRAHVAAAIAAALTPAREDEAAVKAAALREAAHATLHFTYPTSADPDVWGAWLLERADAIENGIGSWT